MADGPDLTDFFRRAVQANARFYKGWVDLSLEYFRGLSEIFGVTDPVAPSAEAASVASAAANALVMEGEEGATVRSAFLVTNDLGRNIKCEFVASTFREPGGAEVPTKPKFEPAKVELAPGEQRVIHAMIAVDPKLAPGVGYTGEISIRGMDAFSVPVIVRRLHGVEATPIGRAAAGAGAPPKPRARAAGSKAGSRKKAARRKPRRPGPADEPTA